MSRNILIVGAGGIGSWLAFNLFKLQEANQLGNVRKIFLADDDTVEVKNIAYQCFENTDILETKVEALSDRFGELFSPMEKRITKQDLSDGCRWGNYDCIVSAVDNTEFRRVLFNYCDDHPSIYWIDLRSEGRTIAAYTKHEKNTLEVMMATIPEEVKEGSCQRSFELSAGIIQNGNKIVAAIGSQFILNWLRGDSSISKLCLNI